MIDRGTVLPCKVLPDGTYGLSEGCSNQYVKCSNGEAVFMSCPLTLAFDVKKEACEYPHTVPACNAQHPPHDLLTGDFKLTLVFS